MSEEKIIDNETSTSDSSNQKNEDKLSIKNEVCIYFRERIKPMFLSTVILFILLFISSFVIGSLANKSIIDFDSYDVLLENVGYLSMFLLTLVFYFLQYALYFIKLYQADQDRRTDMRKCEVEVSRFLDCSVKVLNETNKLTSTYLLAFAVFFISTSFESVSATSIVFFVLWLLAYFSLPISLNYILRKHEIKKSRFEKKITLWSLLLVYVQ